MVSLRAGNGGPPRGPLGEVTEGVPGRCGYRWWSGDRTDISKTSRKLRRLPKRKLIAYIIIACNRSAIVASQIVLGCKHLRYAMQYCRYLHFWFNFMDVLQVLVSILQFLRPDYKQL